MPTRYRLILSVEGAEITSPFEMISADARADIAARLKAVVIGELTQAHRDRGRSDPSAVLPGHLHLHRCAFLGVRRLRRGVTLVDASLTLLSDQQARQRLAERRLKALENDPVRLARTNALLRVARCEPEASLRWGEIVGAVDDAARGQSITLCTPALLRCKSSFKVPDSRALLVAAGWAVRTLFAAEPWISDGPTGVALPDGIATDSMIPDPAAHGRVVDAAALAAAAQRHSAPGAKGLIGPLGYRPAPGRVQDAAVWHALFEWTGLGAYGTIGAGAVTPLGGTAQTFQCVGGRSTVP